MEKVPLSSQHTALVRVHPFAASIASDPLESKGHGAEVQFPTSGPYQVPLLPLEALQVTTHPLPALALIALPGPSQQLPTQPLCLELLPSHYASAGG